MAGDYRLHSRRISGSAEISAASEKNAAAVYAAEFQKFIL